MTTMRRIQLAWACLFAPEPTLRSAMARQLAHKPIDYGFIKAHRRVRAAIAKEVQSGDMAYMDPIARVHWPPTVPRPVPPPPRPPPGAPLNTESTVAKPWCEDPKHADSYGATAAKPTAK